MHIAAQCAPMIPLDEALRPAWLFGATVHEGCDRGGYYEQAEFAEQYGAHTCIVKLGCWGPPVQCNVGKSGWMGGIGPDFRTSSCRSWTSRPGLCFPRAR